MVERGTGQLVFVVFCGQVAAASESSIYTGSKFGLRGFAHGLRAQIAGQGRRRLARDAGPHHRRRHVRPRRPKLPPLICARSPQTGEAVVKAIERNVADVDVASRHAAASQVRCARAGVRRQAQLRRRVAAELDLRAELIRLDPRHATSRQPLSSARGPSGRASGRPTTFRSSVRSPLAARAKDSSPDDAALSRRPGGSTRARLRLQLRRLPGPGPRRGCRPLLRVRRALTLDRVGTLPGEARRGPGEDIASRSVTLRPARAGPDAFDGTLFTGTTTTCPIPDPG